MVSPANTLPPILADAIKGARIKHIPAGQIVLYEGDIPSELYILQSGVVKVFDIDTDGNEKILHLLQPPALLPFAFFSGLENPLYWYYTTLTDCDMYVLDAQEFSKAVEQNGKLGRYLTRNFSNDVHEILVRLSSLNKTMAKDKVRSVLRFLLVCHATERTGGWWRIDFPVNQQFVADLAGITRESTAVVMKELQDEKLLRAPHITTLEIKREAFLDI